MAAVPVLTKQQGEHQVVIMHMVAEHRRRQEEDLMQMVFRLNAAVQHQGGQVVSSEDAGGATSNTMDVLNRGAQHQTQWMC